MKSKHRATKKNDYKMGSVFAIPLKEAGYGLGVVARATKGGGILVYLYGPQLNHLPHPNEWSALNPKNALLRIITSDLLLRDGSWPILGELENFKKEDWLLPKYIRRDALSGCAWLVTYSDNDLDRCLEETRVPFDTIGYLCDSLYGAGAAEWELSETISLGLDRPLPYQPGSVFAIPLKPNGYALGVVAKTTKVGEVAHVYLFGKKYLHVPRQKEWLELDPKEAIARPRILDLNLQNGQWHILGILENWEKTKWPMPKYIWKDEKQKKAKLITYSDSCPAERTHTELVPFEITGYEKNGVHGPSKIEDELSSLLSGIPIGFTYSTRLF